MGLGRFKQTGIKNGEISQKTGATYYSGSPLAINKSGEVVCANADDLNLAKSNAAALSFIGIARNTSASDALGKDKKASFFTGTCIVTFTKNVANANNASINVEGTAGELTDDYPYDTSLAWDEGDRLYIDGSTGTNGKWIRTADNSNDPHYGVVLKVGTNYLTVLMYNSPSVG